MQPSTKWNSKLWQITTIVINKNLTCFSNTLKVYYGNLTFTIIAGSQKAHNATQSKKWL